MQSPGKDLYILKEKVIYKEFVQVYHKLEVNFFFIITCFYSLTSKWETWQK